MTLPAIPSIPQHNTSIDIEVKAIRSAIPEGAALAHRSLDIIVSIAKQLRDERTAAVRAASEGIDRYNKVVHTYNDLERRLDLALSVLRGEDIHENCGY